MTTQGPTEETEEQRVRRMIDERLSEITGQNVGVLLPGDPGHPETASQAPQALSLKEILDQIDPRDSESHIEILTFLQERARLHKAGTLDNVGYLFVYQEPKGASREGWSAGGTQGDRIVDDALAQARQSGGHSLKGLCRHCFSAILQEETADQPVAESPRAGADPSVCEKNDNGPHEFAG